MALHSLRRGIVLPVHLSVSLAVLLFGSVAGAADVRLRADQACAEPGAIVDEVEEIIGRPLASVPGVVFQVDIAHAGTRAWRMRLETAEAGEVAPVIGTGPGAPPRIAPAPPRATRELTAASCAEAASAAAVAIALSIQTASAGKGAAAPVPPSPPPQPAPAAPVIVGARPAPEVARPLRLSAALLAFGDAGGLPHVAAGGELEVAVQRGRLRGVALASGFPPQETTVSASTGGQFTLVFGGLLACAIGRGRSAIPQVCAGGELGRILGEGTGATHPRLGSALWAAARAEVGLAAAISTDWAFVARAALVIPFVRPEFQINGGVPVYTPASVTGRLGAGLQLAF